MATSPLSVPGSRVPIRTLAVEVLSGPDAGKRAEADSERLTIGTARGNVLVLTDPTVSRFHLELFPDENGIGIVDLESTNGTSVGGIRLLRGIIPPGTQLALGRSVLSVTEGAGTRVEVHGGDRLSDILGSSPLMRRLMAQIQRAASVNVPVLVIGETGTGKELVARALHEQGPRADRPLVVVDCGALAPGVVASELFGHER